MSLGGHLALALGALHPRSLRRLLAGAARAAVQAGRKSLRHPHVRFGARVILDGRCAFGEGVLVGPDSTLMATSMGRQSYAAFRFWAANAEIGPFCAIGPGVILGIGRHPTRDVVSSHPAFFSPGWPAPLRYAVQDFEEHLPVRIGADVWIGANAFVAAGVTIGPGAIVGAGAVVTRDVAPYEVVAGVPAKRLRLRFDEADVAWLLSLRWWEWPDARLRELGPAFRDVAGLRARLAAGGGAP